MIKHVRTKEEMQLELSNAGEKLVLVDFFATWCGPCKMIAPTLEKMAAENSGKLVVLKVDVDDAEELSLQYEINAMPTFVFIKNGEKVDRLEGADKNKLNDLISKNM